MYHLIVAETLGPNGKLAFVQCFYIASLLDDANKILSIFCLRWATENDVDHIDQFNPTMSDTVEAGERNGFVPFAFVRSGR